MVNTNKIRGLMAENNLTGTDMAKALSITPKTFYNKMKTGYFDSKEMEIMIPLLKIKDPSSVFFANIVSQKETNESETTNESNSDKLPA